AAYDRRRQSLGLVAHQQQIRLRGRLFQRLEQRVGCGRIHCLRRDDDGNLRASAMCGKMGEVDELAYAVDRDRIDTCRIAVLVEGVRLDEPQVGMRAVSDV